jgi:hypothetical protein
MSLSLRFAQEADLPALAQMNKALIEDEANRNPMSLEQLQQRLAGWLRGEEGDWPCGAYFRVVT